MRIVPGQALVRPTRTGQGHGRGGTDVEDGSEDREGSEDHRQAEPRGIREDARHGLLRRVRRGRPGHGRREGGQEREGRERLREGDTDGHRRDRGVEARQDRRRRVTAAQGFGRQGPGRQDPGDVVEGHQSPRCRRDRQGRQVGERFEGGEGEGRRGSQGQGR